MVRFALKNPYLVVVVVLATLVLGVVSYREIPADLLPILETPAVQIVTFYPAWNAARGDGARHHVSPGTLDRSVGWD